jgi:hypothetical protein
MASNRGSARWLCRVLGHRWAAVTGIPDRTFHGWCCLRCKKAVAR